MTFAAGLLAATLFAWPMESFQKCKFKCDKQECHECCVEVKQKLMESCECFPAGPEKNECLKKVTEEFVECVKSCRPEKCEHECENDCENECK